MNSIGNQERDLAPLEEYASMLVALMIHRRELGNYKPYVANYKEMCDQLTADFRQVLNQMCRSGLLKFRHGDDGLEFEFTPPK